MIPLITINNYEPLANIQFDQTLARVGHINRLITELNSMSLGNPTARVYPVCVECNFPTIQSALDQAILDGVGVGGVKGVVLVHPGTYVENLVIPMGVVIQSYTVTLQPEQVFVVGQHTYTPTTPSVFDNSSAFAGLTLRDNNAGNLFTFTGTGQGLFIMANCFIEKNGVGGSVFMNSTNSVFSLGQTVFLGNPTGAPTIKIQDCSTLVCQNAQFQQNNIAIEVDSTVPGPQAVLIGNFILCQDTHIIKAGVNVGVQLLHNTALNFNANSSAVILDAPSNFCFQNTLGCPTGTGFVINGTGGVQTGGNIYQDNALIAPGITITQSFLDPPKLNLPTSPVGLPTGALWNNLGVVNIV